MVIFIKGEQNMELWDIYDENRNRTGQVIERAGHWGNEKYHLIIHVAIFDSQGRMLIQKRAKEKRAWADLWDISCGGSAVAGEDSRTAAEREVMEELGIKIDLKDVRPHFTMYYERGFDDYYTVIRDIDIDELTLQTEEVSEAKWATLDEVRHLFAEGRFVPYFQPVIELLWQVNDNYDGAIKQH